MHLLEVALAELLPLVNVVMMAGLPHLQRAFEDQDCQGHLLLCGWFLGLSDAEAPADSSVISSGKPHVGLPSCTAKQDDKKQIVKNFPLMWLMS